MLLENGKVYNKTSEKVKVMSEETAYMITDMLITAAQRGVGGVSVGGTQIAAKSGTTNLDKATTLPTHQNMQLPYGLDTM